MCIIGYSKIDTGQRPVQQLVQRYNMEAIKNQEQHYLDTVEALQADFEQARDTKTTQSYVMYLLKTQETASPDMKVLIMTELYAILMDNIGEVLSWGIQFLGLAFNKATEFLNVLDTMTSKHNSQEADLNTAKLALNMFLTMVQKLAAKK